VKKIVGMVGVWCGEELGSVSARGWARSRSCGRWVRGRRGRACGGRLCGDDPL
jgi:hypothetical protein